MPVESNKNVNLRQRPGNQIFSASRHLLGPSLRFRGIMAANLGLLAGNSRYTVAWGSPPCLALTLGGIMTFRYLLHQKQQARVECVARRPSVSGQPCSIPKPTSSLGAFLVSLLFSLVLKPEEAEWTISHCPVHSSTLDRNINPDITSDGILNGNKPNPNCQVLTCLEVQCPPPALRIGQDP